MKALTIQQPHASLIAGGEKWVENRTWLTGYRGTVAIHAGKGTRYLTARELWTYPTGVVIAVADLVACIDLKIVRIHRSHWHVVGLFDRLGISVEEFLAHEHTEGPWCWILKDVRKLDVPAPAVGKQGLWEWRDPR